MVERDGGYIAMVADACVIVSNVNPENVTPHTEAFQAGLLRCESRRFRRPLSPRMT